jgi:hypothetical protein
MRAADLDSCADQIVVRFGGEIVRHDAFTVVRTPPDPTCLWGDCADRLVMIADAHDVARLADAGAGFVDVGVWRGQQRLGY